MSKNRLGLHNISQQLERIVSDLQLAGLNLFDKRRFKGYEDTLLIEAKGYCEEALRQVNKAKRIIWELKKG